VTNGRNVIIDIRFAIKESVTVAKDVGASRQIDQEEAEPGGALLGPEHDKDHEKQRS
jgi:hypothetical protein